MAPRRVISVAAAVLALVAAGLTAGPAATAAGPTACPSIFPVSRAVDGVVGTGYTVERGTIPQPFTATLLGRITDGIAPGVDMIMADLDSPALTRAGGVWAGMSGSPVYARDGRLIGSVSYGLAGNSTIAGLTPAAGMKALLSDIDDAAAARPAVRVSVGAGDAERLARTGEVTAAEAAGGFRQLPVPLLLSGASSPSATTLVERFSARVPGARVLTSGAAASGTAAASSIAAGGNFVAALSYGDVTSGAAGTTTFVCGGRAVAFGHPFFNEGVVAFSAHPATALFVQPDPLFGPFKVSNAGGVAGTVDRDRRAGIRAQLGVAPVTTLISSTITRSTGQVRTGISRAVYPPFVPDIAAFHTLYNVESVLGSAGKGSASITLAITGKRADGRTFTVTRSDVFSSPSSIGFTVADRVYFTLVSLVNQPFEKIQITKVSITGTVNPAVREYRVTSIKVKQGGVYVTPSTSTPLVGRAGRALPVRATLTPYLGVGPTRTVDLAPVVPAGTAGSFGSLTLTGGAFFDPFGGTPASSFTELLAQIRNAPSSATVRSVVAVDGPTGTVSGAASTVVDQAVAFSENSFPVEVR